MTPCICITSHRKQRTFIASTQILPLFSYDFPAEQYIILALRFNVQRNLCAIEVKRHKYFPVRGGSNFSHSNEWL
jgi:hypothetical protein